MPVPAPRDPGVTRASLTRWLGHPARLPGARIADHYMNWAYPGQKPTAARALTWLKEHKPSEQNAPVGRVDHGGRREART